MGLSTDLISQFVKVTNDTKVDKKETTVYGTVVIYNGLTYAKIDGSDSLTPISTTTELKEGERVSILIKNHTATVNGNLSSPSASTGTVQAVNDKIVKYDAIYTEKLTAQEASIKTLTADNVTIKEKLTANEAYISDLQADNVTINGKLTAQEADIKKIETEKLSAETADIKFATIEKLEVTDAYVRDLEADYGDFVELTTNSFKAVDANIKTLETEKLNTKDFDTKFANIDFANIGEAWFQSFFAESGLIKDVTVGDQTITGTLVGVTITGDLIKGGTVVADKLVIQGEDGLYYKLNTDGETVEKEQTDYNSLNGKVITAKSITAEKISVSDLVAFGATIGGMHLSSGSIYSGVKESVHNTTSGFYIDKEGQLSLGDANQYLKFYKNALGKYVLEMAIDRLTIGSSNTDVGDKLDSIQSDVDSLRDEITTLLRIESSRGTVFKNDSIATVLSVVIYHGTQRITDSETMKSVFGNGSYLQWKWQRLDEDSYGVISSSDSRFGDNGFTFTLSPEDVDTKVTFMCELIT